MAVHKIYRDSDLRIRLCLKDADSQPYRVSSTVRFAIRFFTTNEQEFIEASYIHGHTKNLSTDEDSDYAVFPREALKRLKDGVIYYSYEVTFLDTSGKDYLFKETVQGQSEMILKTRVKHVKQD